MQTRTADKLIKALRRYNLAVAQLRGEKVIWSLEMTETEARRKGLAK